MHKNKRERKEAPNLVRRSQNFGSVLQLSYYIFSSGLEWDVVFVPNVNEELFPHRMNPDEEEERRLFYVAHDLVNIYLLVGGSIAVIWRRLMKDCLSKNCLEKTKY